MCAWLALVLCASSLGASLVASAARWIAAPNAEPLGRADTGAKVDRGRDVEGDSDEPAIEMAGTLHELEEEEREDDPVGAEPKLTEVSENTGRVVAWERPAFRRPVSDPVADRASPPPRG